MPHFSLRQWGQFFLVQVKLLLVNVGGGCLEWLLHKATRTHKRLMGKTCTRCISISDALLCVAKELLVVVVRLLQLSERHLLYGFLVRDLQHVVNAPVFAHLLHLPRETRLEIPTAVTSPYILN